MVVMFLIENVGGIEFSGMDPVPVNEYLKEADFEFGQGMGAVITTPNKAEAKQFESNLEALEYWRTVSKVRPLRPDGKPNRPLTAFTVTLEKVDKV